MAPGDGEARCFSGNQTGTAADYEVCAVVALELRDNNLAGVLNLSRLCELPHLAKIDVGSGTVVQHAPLNGDVGSSGSILLQLAHSA